MTYRDGSGFIQVDAESGYSIFLNSERVGSIAQGFSGALIEGVPTGRHVLRIERPGFTPQAWPIEVGDGEIVSIVARSSVPALPSAGEDLRRSREATESALSLIELNRQRGELSELNSGSTSFEAPTIGRHNGNSCNRDRDQSFDGRTRNIVDTEVFSEDGTPHKLLVNVRFYGRMRCWERRRVEYNEVDMRAEYEVLLDNAEVDKFTRRFDYSWQMPDIGGFFAKKRNGERERVRQDLEGRIERLWRRYSEVREYSVYPVSISLSSRPRQRPYGDMERVAQLFDIRVEWNSSFN